MEHSHFTDANIPFYTMQCLRRSNELFFPVINDADAGQRNDTPDNVIPVRYIFIKLHSPKQGEYNKETSVCSVYLCKTGCLPGSYNTVENQDKATQYALPEGLVLPEPLPYQVAASDLAEPRQDKY